MGSTKGKELKESVGEIDCKGGERGRDEARGGAGLRRGQVGPEVGQVVPEAGVWG